MWEPRSAFGACAIRSSEDHDRVYIFGGSGDNNVKYNDLWELNGNSWTQIKPT